MSLFKILKVAWRSRSSSFAADYRASAAGRELGLGSFTWRAGDGAAVQYRRGTSDIGLIYDILLKPGRKAEYWLPQSLAPRIILDIGANIGVASRYLAHHFPNSAVHSFEPVPENLKLLGANAACQPRIIVHPYALGPQTGQIALGSSDASGRNQGGYSAFAASTGNERITAPIRNVATALASAGIDAVDVIKIDTEGAEFSILGAIPEEIIGRAAWIYGELHSEAIARPSDFRVLDLLSRWFDIEVYKPMRKRNYFFDACRKDLCGGLRDFKRYR